MICEATTLDGHKDALVDQVYTVVTRYESYPKNVEILWHNVTASMLEERQHKNITQPQQARIHVGCLEVLQYCIFG
jgi:hypothetical protein